MFTVNRHIQRTTIRHFRRRITTTSCNKSTPNVNKSTGNSPSWSTQFLSKNKDNDEDDKKTTASKEDNEFIASLFSNKAWLSEKMDWLGELPTMEELNTKMNELYPQFTSQFTQLTDSYQKVWDYLTMEEFRALVDEINRDAKDVHKFPELAKTAIVR